MTTLYLVRHGITAQNLEHRMQGLTDAPLCAEGERQLPYLAAFFEQIPLQAVFCSPYRRTIQTASAVAAACGLPLQFKSDLRERSAGDYEGYRVDDLVKTLGLESRKGGPRYPIRFELPTAEPICNVYARMSTVLREILEEYQGKSVAVVSHGMALQMAIAFLMGTPLKEYQSFPLPNCSVCKVLFKENRADFEYIGKVDFIPQDLLRVNQIDRKEIRQNGSERF